MRSTHGRSKWLVGSEAVQGLVLGAAFASEHEHGVKRLAVKFGIVGEVSNDPIRIVTLPREFGTHCMMVAGAACVLLSSNVTRALDRFSRGEFSFDAPNTAPNTTTAWDRDDFAILCQGADVVKLLELERAFNEHRVAFRCFTNSSAQEGLVLDVFPAQ